jgi:hypothetical protein
VPARIAKAVRTRRITDADGQFVRANHRANNPEGPGQLDECPMQCDQAGGVVGCEFALEKRRDQQAATREPN